MNTRTTTDHTSDSERAEIQHLLDQWAAAIVANDPERIAAFAEPDWLLITPESGPIPLERFLTVVANGSLTHTEMTFEVLEVRRRDDMAIVIAHGTNRGTFNGAPFTADELVTEVFIRGANGWKCTVSALTPRTPGAAQS